MNRLGTAAGVLVWLLQCQSGSAQPSISSVANSASYSTSVAQGSIFVVFGFGLGPATLVQTPTYPLTTQLAGTSVKVVAGGTTFPCPIFYTSATVLAAVLPSKTPVGEGSLTVTYNGRTSFSVFIRVAKSAVGIYTLTSSGMGGGIVTGDGYVTKSLLHSARRGEIVTAWATGMGPIEGSDADVPTPGSIFNAEVFVGDRSAKVSYAGRSGCCPGLDQIAFEVPDAPQSCVVPLSIRTSGGSSNFVTLPIADGAQCSNPPPGVPTEFLTRATNGEPLSIGHFSIGPVSILQGAGFSFVQGLAAQLSRALHARVSEADVSRLVRAYRVGNMAQVRRTMAQFAPQLKAADPRTRNVIRAAISGDSQGAGARFGKSSGIGVLTAQLASDFPGAGTCTVVQNLPLGGGIKSSALDAGNTLTVDGPAGRKTMTRIASGQYQALMGTGVSPTSTTTGLYTISGTGGANLGAFSVSLNITSTLVWTNKAAVNTVDRTRPLTVTWSGGPVPGYIVIGGATRSSERAALFICAEDSRKGTFSIPEFVLSALPSAAGTLFLAPHPMNKQVQVPGLDLAFISEGSYDARDVAFQ